MERPMAGLLVDRPLKENIQATTQVFSPGSLPEFETYLLGLLKAASKEHLAAVDEVYGDRYDLPNFTILEDL